MNRKIEIDIEKKEIILSEADGNARYISFSFEDIENNPKILTDLRQEDAYVIGVINSLNKNDKISIVNKKKQYILFDFFLALFVIIMISSNLLSIKFTDILGVSVPVGFFLFPFSYILDYLIADVYGYKNARRVLWIGILSILVLLLCLYILVVVPASNHVIPLGNINNLILPFIRNLMASLVAFSISFFISIYILQKLKTKNKKISLFKRIFRSFLISEIIDLSIFCSIAYIGIWDIENIFKFILFAYSLRVIYEFSLYRIITKPIVMKVHDIEELDIVDYHTNFSPFLWNSSYSKENNIYKKRN